MNDNFGRSQKLNQLIYSPHISWHYPAPSRSIPRDPVQTWAVLVTAAVTCSLVARRSSLVARHVLDAPTLYMATKGSTIHATGLALTALALLDAEGDPEHDQDDVLFLLSTSLTAFGSIARAPELDPLGLMDDDEKKQRGPRGPYDVTKFSDTLFGMLEHNRLREYRQYFR